MTMVCPACGRNVPVENDGAVAVPSAVECPACGKRIRVAEPAAPAVPAWDDVGFAADASTTSSTVRRPPTPVRPRWPWVAVAVLACGGGSAYLALRWVKPMAPPPTPPAVAATPAPTTAPADDDLRRRLVALKADGDVAAAAGDWPAAHAAYGQVLGLAALATTRNSPATLALVEAARDGQRQAREGMLRDRTPATVASTDRGPTTVAVAPPTPPVPPASPPAAAPATRATTRPSAVPPPVFTAADSAPPVTNPPPPPALHAYTVSDAVTDQQIGRAIGNGIAFLKRQFANGELTVGVADDENFNGAYTKAGLDALCAYALLHAAEATDVKGAGGNDPFAAELLDRLKRLDLQYTYHRSLRAAALGVYHRAKDQSALEADVRWLIANQKDGAYSYPLPAAAGMPAGMWDNSNSQYGLLGVWSGSQAGVGVPAFYWEAVQRHWVGCQYRDGTWGYEPGTPSTLSMTLAGAASMLVARDYLDAPAAVGATLDRSSRAVATDAALAWLDAGDNCIPAAGSQWPGYTRYGLERVGLASGYKYFGGHDWYTEVAAKLVDAQRLDGSWPGVENAGGGPVNVGPPNGPPRRGPNGGGGGGGRPADDATPGDVLVESAYNLLFLARGRHPILYNKLRYDGDWNDRPQEVAHLARFASAQIERPMNWQVVNLHHPWWDWCDSPVLYIAGDRAPKMTDADLAAVRDFALGGGLVVTHADGGRESFNLWVKQAARKMFPAYELVKVPRADPVNTVVVPLKNPPPLLSLTNGSRLLMVHSPTDVSRGWQLNWTGAQRADFDLGLNLFVYAAGKGQGFHNRLASTYVPECPHRPTAVHHVVRLRYPSVTWNPEPYAWTRFARYFQWETREAVDATVVDVRSLKPGDAPLAVLTGTVRADLTPTEVAAVRAYVEAGGVLLVDACGGRSEFARSVDQLLAEAFPGGELTAVTQASPVLVPSRPGADDLRKPSLRPYAVENGGRDLPMRELVWGRGRVIYSRLDLTTGLLGTESWGILGYSPAYAQAVVKNAVLWSVAREQVARASRP